MDRGDENLTQLVLLQEIAESLHELMTWTRVIGHSAVRQVLATALDSDEKRQVYQLTDGHRGVAEIQKLTGVNARFISEWGRQWERIGIVEQSHVSEVKGRRQKVFDLAAFGISVLDQTEASEE